MIPADETFDGTWPYQPHFLQEDAPETVTALIGQFMQMTSR